MEPVFLSLDEVLEIHEQQIERYGGSSGLRDGGGLESAAAMPQATFGGEFLHISIPAMAAAYLFHLLPEPPVPRRQQTSGCERCHQIPANQPMGANFRRGGTRGPGSVRDYGGTEQAGADRDLRIPLQASRRHVK